MKKYLLSLLFGFVGLIGFCSAGSYTFTGIVNNNTHYVTFPQGLINGCDFYLSCFYDNTVQEYLTLIIGYNGGSSFSFGNNTLKKDYGSFGFDFNKRNGCTSVENLGFYTYNANNYNYTCTLYGNSITTSNCPECPTCPEVNTGEILSGYILESEIDSGYCISNDLCPVFTGNNFSELIINDIVHESAPLINITIPEEYTWDYSLDENEFSLNISGQNVDYEYIDGIIKTQNSKPTVEDFNKIISELLPLFVPGLVIILFLIFVFRFVKKVF